MSQSQPNFDQFPQNQPYQARSRSGGVFRFLIGCATVGLFCVLGCGFLGFFLFRTAVSQLNNLGGEYIERGFEQRIGQMVAVDTPLSKPTVLIGQMVSINQPAQTDLAIIAQLGDVKANIIGNVDFKGQSLIVRPNAIIDGDLNIIAAQVVDIQGKVLGKISGSYQSLKYEGKQYLNSAPLPEPVEIKERDFELGGIKVEE